MSLHVDIISPERRVLSEEVDFVAAPAYDGEVGILPGHAPLLTRLGVGELRLKKGAEVRSLVLSGGFMEVQHGSRVSIFAETAEMEEEIDVERAKLAADRAKTKLAAPQDLTGEELAALEAALTRATTRVRVAQLRRQRRPQQTPPH